MFVYDIWLEYSTLFPLTICFHEGSPFNTKLKYVITSELSLELHSNKLNYYLCVVVVFLDGFMIHLAF